MKRTIAAALAAASLAAAGSVAAADDMAEAMQFFESAHYVLARDHLRAAARNGDARAAEILGFMYGFGSDMFPGVGRDLDASAHWFDMAARGGRPVGRYMVCALRKHTGVSVPAPQRCFDWVAETGRPAPR
jgi:TPR repeat protein